MRSLLPIPSLLPSRSCLSFSLALVAFDFGKCHPFLLPHIFSSLNTPSSISAVSKQSSFSFLYLISTFPFLHFKFYLHCNPPLPFPLHRMRNSTSHQRNKTSQKQVLKYEVLRSARVHSSRDARDYHASAKKVFLLCVISVVRVYRDECQSLEEKSEKELVGLHSFTGMYEFLTAS